MTTLSVNAPAGSRAGTHKFFIACASVPSHGGFLRVQCSRRLKHLTLHGLKDELAARGVYVSHNSVWLFLRREGLSFKKNSVRP